MEQTNNTTNGAAEEEQVEAEQVEAEQAAGESAKKYTGFPHDVQVEHWDVDFSDGKQVYEGMALPVWILAGWAIFIIWAVVYLTAGVRTTF